MRSKLSKRIALLTTFFLLILVLSVAGFYLYLQSLVFHHPLDSHLQKTDFTSFDLEDSGPEYSKDLVLQEKCFLVKPGEHFKQFTKKFSDQSDLPFPTLFNITVKLLGKSRQLKVGEYCFNKNTTVQQVIETVTQGEFKRRKFTIISGQTYQQLKQEILQTPGLRHQLVKTTDKQLAYLLQLPRVEFEGEFLPETYRYAYPESGVDLLIEAHNFLLKKLYQGWENRTADLPYKTPYQALIAASIIEKESAIASDRRLISGVIVNRLNKHMRLQMDPTVIYGLKKTNTKTSANGKISLTKNLMRQDTPYNTYLHWGLPPTPICMPSADAIEAAMNPTPSEYLYFVAKGNGYHQFSKTLIEQRAAIKKYLLHQENK